MRWAHLLSYQRISLYLYKLIFTDYLSEFSPYIILDGEVIGELEKRFNSQILQGDIYFKTKKQTKEAIE